MSDRYRIGIDIGGTFTDFTIMRESGESLLWKEDSTPDDPLRAVLDGLTAVCGQLDVSLSEFFGRTKLFVHGTTIATNLLIQRRGPETALLCTEGFRDVLHYRDGFKSERFDIHFPHPAPLVPRRLRIGIPERIDAEGEVLTALDEDAVIATAAKLRDAGVEAVAVAYLWSVVNPSHEQRTAEILESELPGAHVVRSSDVLGELREWERTSAAVLSAYIRPSVADYLARLEEAVDDGGLVSPPLVMQCNGGCGRVEEIIRRPVSILSSGPTAAPAAAIHVGRSSDARDLITVDIGGTSCDVCIIRDREPTISRTLRVDDQPLGIPGVEVDSIGAGGGSIAWVDDGGALRVGPNSAGAVPGPVCYARGGERPTVTDANLVLGLFSDQAFLEGRKRLDKGLSEKAILEHVGEPLGLGTVDAAVGVRRVVEANMVSAIRALSTERGIDPRGFVLVCGGGGGGVHGVGIARSLGVGEVLVPAASGTLCSFGMTVTDVRHDYARALHQGSNSLDGAAIAALFEEMETEARDRLRQGGFEADAIVLERLVDARYPGQVHELTVTVPGEPSGEGFAAALAGGFHAEHERQYTYAREELPVEFLHWRVRAIGRTELVAGASRGSGEKAAAEPVSTRRIWSEADGHVDADVYTADQLRGGVSIEGPAVIDCPTTTVAIGSGDVLTVSSEGDMLIKVDLDEK